MGHYLDIDMMRSIHLQENFVNHPAFNGQESESSYRYGPLRKTILSSMILAPILIYILALGIGYFYFTFSLRTSSMSHMKRILGDHRQMIDSFLEERKGDLAFILETFSYEELQDPEVLRQLLKRVQKTSPVFVDLGIFDTRGVHINYQGPYDLTGKIYKNETWFKAVMENGVYISDVFMGFRKIPHFVIAMVKHSPTNTWVIRATIDTLFFNSLVEQISMGHTGEAYILNAKGLLQTKPRSGGDLMDPEPADHELLVFHQGMELSIKANAAGDESLVATTWLKNKLWMLVVKQDKADAFRTLNTASILIVLTTIIGILIIVLVSFYFTTRIVSRLEKMDLEKEKLRFQLIHASGLAELGEMATGFAHEINNPLQIIKSEQALVQMNVVELVDKEGITSSDLLAEVADSLNQISLQIDRCAMITQSILKFGRRNEPVSQSLDLKRFIPEIIAIVDQRANLQNIDLQFNTDSRFDLITADPAQLQQVFLNLFNNAIDAVVEKHGPNGGWIHIAATNTHKDAVEMTISDNGIGISPENLKKVFTPFFTTKPVGKGTGLGLSVCYGIIKSMGGEMTVFSTNESGTVFKINLPSEKGNVWEKKTDEKI
jgi:two-component system, NtrC family, sensor kinase